VEAALNAPARDGPFDLGVEEEYQVVDPQTWQLRSRIDAILERDQEDGTEDVRAEFLQSQLEAVTRICDTVQELRVEVVRMRREAHAIARSLGLALVAAGTHPFSRWTQQRVTRGNRYAVLAEELQEVGRRLVTFGLHIHIGIADPDLRIRILGRLRSYLPLLLALSTSSPFFEGRLTGLRSYRTAIFSALPRTGIPPRFASWADYQAAVEQLTAAGLLTAPGFIWWDARPNSRFPTLEVRIPDVPTRVEETVCLAAWVQALAVKLAREPDVPPLRRFIVETNKWQAARYGLEARLLIRPDRPAQPVREWVEVLLDWLADVGDELNSQAELAYARSILKEGTSAEWQLRTWRETNDLCRVVEHLANETLEW
jgi:carboxylate-amine ligase